MRGIYFVKKKDIQDFLDETGAVILRWNKRDNATKGMADIYNMGEVKGLEFDSVLISPTASMLDILQGRGNVESDIVLAKLYVAVTRPRYILGVIVSDGFNDKIDGFSWYTPL